jgi:hypothetical protein
MLSNPLIQRYRYSVLRPSHFFVYMTIYISVVILLLFINYTIYKYQDTFCTLQDLCKAIYYQFLAFEIIVLWFWGALSSASAIKDEITGKTYDFFRMLPLTARQKAVGILFGKNLVILLLGAISCIFLVLFGTVGQLGANLQIQTFLALFSITILVNSVALLLSFTPDQKTQKTNVLILLVLFFFLANFMIGVLSSLYKTENLEDAKAWFFVIKLPIFILISLIALYFSCWAIKGILRKFTREDEPLFTRKGALLFMVGFEFILLGLFYPLLGKSSDIEISYLYWMFSLAAALIIPLGALRSFDKYLEYIGLVREKSGSKSVVLHLLVYSNISLVLGLFAIWSAGSLATIFISEIELIQGLSQMLVLFSFYIFLTLLLEVYTLYKPSSGKIGHLLCFIVGVYAILPLILSGIFESKIIYMYSPLGFLFKIMDTSGTSIILLTSIWVVNTLLCVIPLLLVQTRYSHILALRQKM